MKLTATVSLFLGIIVGLGIYIAQISNVVSYMSDEPTACINCHVMNTAYDTWSHSAHREVTTCNSCHVPHDNIIRTYMFKALDGLKHSYMFTTRSEHQAIRIGAMGSAVVQKNCISCHNQKILAHDNLFNQKQIDNKTEVRCWTCHKSTPHGETRSLSTTYRNINPNKIKNEPLVPEWIKEELKKESERKDETK